MAYFRWAYNLANRVSPAKQFPIVTSSAIEKGEIVKFTGGTGIEAVAGTDFDDPAVGVAAENHNGSTADGRQTGAVIDVYSDPADVFELESTNELTLTGGSTTTAIDSNLLPATDNIWKEGYIKIVTCAANSNLVGKMVKIASSVGASGTLTLAETLPSALASGDKICLYPGKLAIGQFGWDLNSDGTDVNYESSGGEALQLVDADPERRKAFFKLRLHQFGNDAAAK